jgi:RNA polymerase sigma factor (sigma-70 family)
VFPAAFRRPPADEVTQVFPAAFRRPPADPASHVLPAGFRRPPADPAGRLLSDRAVGPSAELSDQPPPSWTHELPPLDAEYDREVVAAIAAGDPAGMGMAYDRYAAALYGYCHWMLHGSPEAAESLQDTFILAAATLNDLPEPAKLRPWLFTLARHECRRRIRPRSGTRDESDAADQRAEEGQRADEVGLPDDATTQFVAVGRSVDEPGDGTRSSFMVSQLSDATMQFRVVSEPAAAADGLADVHGYLGQAELRALIRSTLADLKPREREVVELSFRHDLDDDDLAIVLGVSLSRAHALASRAGVRLEKSFAALRTALAGRGACPVVGELLADWDGELTEQTRDLVAWHIEQCQICANHGPGALRPTALSGLLPLAPLPLELREQVMSRCFAPDEDAVAHRRRVVRRAKSTWLSVVSPAVRRLSWDGIRASPGAAIAATAVALWLAAVVSVALLAFAGSRDAHAQAPQPSAGTSSSRPATASASASGRVSAKAAPSPTVSQLATYRPSPVQPLLPSPSYVPRRSPSPPPSPSAKPSKSPSSSPKPSKSPSPKPSKSPSPKPSPSSSPSATT